MGARIHFESAHTAIPSNNITGNGTINQVAKFTGANVIGDSIITDNGTGVGIGTSTIGLNDRLLIKTSVDSSFAQGLVIQRSVNTDEGYISYNGGAFQFRATDGDPIILGQVSNERMRIDSTGNVGIGETTPTARLHVKGSGTTGATNAFLVQNGAGTDMLGIYDNGRVFFGNASVNQPYIINFDGSSTEGGNGQAMRIRQQANINGILMQYFADGLFNNTTSGNNVSHDFFATGYRGATGSGNYNALRLGYTINNVSGSTQTGTARGILVNATETLLEGMLHKLMDLQVGGSSKFEVLSTGSTAVSINSTTQGFLPPRMNTVQRNAIVTPAAGLMVYDTDDNKLYVFTTLWEQITSL
jgi:hypothetical protein